MFFLNPNFYYVTIALQAICVLHCMKKGNQNKWIWIIVFLPLIGCLVYFFTEMFTSRDIQKLQSGIGEVINPSGNIKRLEENLRFADTFANRIALADAYLDAGYTDKAVALYEESRTGVFAENEHILLQLIRAYSIQKRYEELIVFAQKMYKAPQFYRSRGHLLFAKALVQAGRYDEAEKEFKTMQGKYSHFEARYEYGLFLARANRDEEARRIFLEISGEAKHLSPRERRSFQPWFAKAKDELNRMKVAG